MWAFLTLVGPQNARPDNVPQIVLESNEHTKEFAYRIWDYLPEHTGRCSIKVLPLLLTAQLSRDPVAALHRWLVHRR